MRKLILILWFISLESFAAVNIDLTKPSNFDQSEYYPSYQEIFTSSFSDNGGYYTKFGLKKFKTDERAALLYMAAISKDESKTQRIYIFLPNKCAIKRALNNDLIVKLDNQDVRFSQFCTGKQIYLTPETDRGEKFLIEQFMRKKLVYFHF